MAQDGARERSYPPVDEALAIARTLGPDRRKELVAMLHAAGDARHQSGDYAAARPYLEEALRVHRASPDSGSPAIAPTLVNLAFLAENRGDRREALAYFREVLELRRREVGAEHTMTAKSMLDLAGSLTRDGWVEDPAQAEEAEQLVREATAIQRRVSTDPLLRIGGYSTMARVLTVRGKHAEAAAAQREVLALNRQLRGDSSAAVAMAIANLAGYVQRAGQLDEAAELHGEAVRRFTARNGPRHVSTAISTTNLAWTERLRLRFAESEALYRRALPALDSAWSSTGRISSTLVDFGIVLSLQNKHREAEAAFRRALAAAERGQPPIQGDLGRARSFLGQTLLKARRFAEAEPLLTDAYQGVLKSLGPNHQYTLNNAGYLVRLYEAWGRPADADRYRAREK
jgi:tetratricopeptide (TPR) repeat protein